VSGRSGSRVAAHTSIVRRGDVLFRASVAQRDLLRLALKHGGTMYVMGAQVRTARACSSFGTLEDHGRMGPGGNWDGERWYFRVFDDVEVVR
jgi:hypothetical protein